MEHVEVTQFQAELSAAAAAIPQAIGAARNALAFTLLHDIQDEATPPTWRVDTGFSLACWGVSPTEVQEIPRDDTNIAASIANAKSIGEAGAAAVRALTDGTQEIWVGDGADYASFLEFGGLHNQADLVATRHTQTLELKSAGIIEEATHPFFAKEGV